MKKLMSIILALTLILPCVSVFALHSSADDKYAELWKQREEYLCNKYDGYDEYLKNADSEDYVEVPGYTGGIYYKMLFDACDLTVLLY